MFLLLPFVNYYYSKSYNLSILSNDIYSNNDDNDHNDNYDTDDGDDGDNFYDVDYNDDSIVNI